VQGKHDEKPEQCDKVLSKVNGILGMKTHKSDINEKRNKFKAKESVGKVEIV
jgi:hypothetical protein